MKSQFSLFLFAAGLALLLPSSQSRSQLAPLPAAPTDALETLQLIQKTNVDLLKRQDDTLKDLLEQTNTAREARIFSKRS